MHSHVIPVARWLCDHRHQLGLATGLATVLALLVAAAPLLLMAAVIETRHARATRRRFRRTLGLQALVLLAKATRWLWLELHGLPHRSWHGCAQCGVPIEAPSRAAYCSHVCRRYARLGREALDHDPRIAARAEWRLRNLRLRTLADNDPDLANPILMAVTINAATVERRRDWALPATPQRKQGEVVVADGYGITLRVLRGQLHVSDGIGRDRRERVYARATNQLSRLVVLGGSGTLSLEAIRWIQGVGASLACIDRDGRLMVTSEASKSEAKLRRAQALAPFNANGLEITKELLRSKLGGQQQVLDRQLKADPHPQRVLERTLTALDAASTIEDVVAAEAEAAGAYWSAWANVEVRFAPADRLRIPDAWLRFGSRTSLIGGGPRLAVTPAGAILNYLYALLEAEARLACLTLGLDPALAIVHADIRGRDSLPLDVMEAVRPNVDRYLLALLRDRVFRAGDFYETQRGNVRLLAPLTHELAETLPVWRQLIAPVAEQVALLLVKSDPKLVRVPTPLTEANRRADRAQRHTTAARAVNARALRPERRCKRCGGELPHKGRIYCDPCLPEYRRDQYREGFGRAGVAALARSRAAEADPSHGGGAGERRRATMVRRRQELREWKPKPGDSEDRETFIREVLPLIQGLPLSSLVGATGLSLRYVSLIRRGEKTPHPRHWDRLREASETVSELVRGDI